VESVFLWDMMCITTKKERIEMEPTKLDNNEFEPLMRWRKFDPRNIPIGDTFWRIDDLKSSVSYHHGYYWYKEGIYSYLILSSYDDEVEHLSPSMLVERNAHWISPYDIGLPE